MHWDMPVPIDRLTWFQEKLGIDGTGLEALEVYKSLFLARKESFAEDFYAYFYKIPETKLQIEHERRRGLLKSAWTGWFESLFTEGFSEAFLDSHWRSGVRHVEVNIDHRFITLGYALVRQFCQKIAKAEIPLADRQRDRQDGGFLPPDRDAGLYRGNHPVRPRGGQGDLSSGKKSPHRHRRPHPPTQAGGGARKPGSQDLRHDPGGKPASGKDGLRRGRLFRPLSEGTRAFGGFPGGPHIEGLKGAE